MIYLKKMTQKPLLTVSIVTYNSPTIASCLEAIFQNNRSMAKEIFVVDNNSRFFDTRKLNGKFPEVKVIKNSRNLGYGAAHNMAIRRAQGEFILIMNPDVILKEGSLETLINYLIKNPEVKIAAPKLLNPDGSLQLSCGRLPTLLISLVRRLPIKRWFRKLMDYYKMTDFGYSQPMKVDWASGACLMLRGKQYFDERYFLYYEDVDLCRGAGEVHYVPKALAIHIGSYQSNRLGRAFFHHLASVIKYYLKWGIS